ncbi:MAG: sigma-70 family RNA polymerase sigma factor [Chloroflexi bacterium]|nr:sigma-70 family RNA polymerase sigma factor [Chloroflexota bacterium]
MEQSEASLIERAREGELDAFNLLVERYERPLYNLCLRMLSSQQSAEDATQDAFISAYRSIRSFRGGSFKSWLFRIGANACYDELRRQRSRPSRSLDEPVGEDERTIEVPDTGPTPEESAENVELRDAMGEAIAGLPPDQRLAIIMRDVQGLDYEEISEATNANLGTVKSRINRARTRLRKALLAKRELLPSRLRQS